MSQNTWSWRCCQYCVSNYVWNITTRMSGAYKDLETNAFIPKMTQNILFLTRKTEILKHIGKTFTFWENSRTFNYIFSNHFTPGPAADNHIATCAQSHALTGNPWALTLLHPSITATFLLGWVSREADVSDRNNVKERRGAEEETSR